MNTTRARQVIVTRHSSTGDRAEISGAPVWGWSPSDGASDGEPCVVNDAIPGDYIVHHDPWTLDGRRRLRPWSVVRARPRGAGLFHRRLANVAIGTGGISNHRTVEAAVKAAAAMLRRDEKARADAARAACERNEPTDCPDAHACRHGIDG